jgi:ribosomal protein S18 acetylase RimI-like enzyme
MTESQIPVVPEQPVDVTIATPDDRERVLGTIVRAFEDDPFLRLALPDADDYAEYAPQFFGTLFDRRVERTTVWMANGGAAVALWDAPDVPLGDDPTENLPKDAKKIIDAYEESLHEVMPTLPHWYLGVLATDPDARGRGLARAVLQRGLSHAASAALPAVLETTNPGNLEIYRRLGWRVIAEAAQPLPIWILQFDPPGS